MVFADEFFAGLCAGVEFLIITFRWVESALGINAMTSPSTASASSPFEIRVSVPPRFRTTGLDPN